MPTEERPIEERKFDFRIYLVMLVFRWKLVTVCFLYGLLGGVIYLQRAVPLYHTVTRVMIYSEQTLKVVPDVRPSDPTIMAYAHHLRGGRLRNKVAEALASEWADRVGGRRNLLLTIEIAPFGFQGRMMSIYTSSAHPEYARVFLGRLWDEFLKEQAVRVKDAAGDSLKAMDRELLRLEEQIKTAEADLDEFLRVNRISYMEQMGRLEVDYLTQLWSRHMQVGTEIMMLELQFPLLTDANPTLLQDVASLTEETGKISGSAVAATQTAQPPPPVETTAARPAAASPAARPPAAGASGTGDAGLPDAEAAPADGASDGQPSSPAQARRPSAKPGTFSSEGWLERKVELARLKDARADLLKNLKPAHPTVAALDARIAAINREFEIQSEIAFERMRDRYRALQLQSRVIEAAQRRWQTVHRDANKKRLERQQLQMSISRLQNAYDGLYGRMHDLKVQREIETERFEIVEKPVTSPQSPVWPEPRKILLMACAMGLGAGLGLALLAHLTDDKVQSIVDVESALGLPFLGGIPLWGRKGLGSSVRPIVTEEHSTGAIEAYRAIRTNVLSVMNKGSHKMAVVTSADSKEGKTLTVLNLAIMVAQTGSRVLLVDADMRRGRLNRSFGLDRKPGLTDALDQNLPLRDVIQPTRIPNLWFVPSGSSHGRCSELLQSRNLGACFGAVADDYDFIFIDSSPVLRTSDTVILAEAGFAAVIYVAHVNRTAKRFIRYSLDLLKNATVIGMIVNFIDMYKISSIYYAYQYPNYAYYAYAYAYGYDYYDDDGKRRVFFRRKRHNLKGRIADIGREIRRRFSP